MPDRLSHPCHAISLAPDPDYGHRGGLGERIRSLEVQNPVHIWYWPQAHNDVVQKILRLARRGVKVVYVPGNHDEVVRDFCGVHFGGVLVARDAIHETADGRRFLVTHGDEFDGVVQHAKWLALVGDYAYRTALLLNTLFQAA